MTKEELKELARTCIKTSYPNGWRSDDFDPAPLKNAGFQSHPNDGAYEYDYVSQNEDIITFVIVPSQTGGANISFCVYPNEVEQII